MGAIYYKEFLLETRSTFLQKVLKNKKDRACSNLIIKGIITPDKWGPNPHSFIFLTIDFPQKLTFTLTTSMYEKEP
jgi:hypothetical protein